MSVRKHVQPSLELLENRRLLSSDLTITFVPPAKAPAIILPGSKQTAKFQVKSSETQKTSLPITVYVSDAATLDADSSQQTILTTNVPLQLKAGKSKNITVHFTMPASFVTGTSYILISTNQQVFSSSAMYNPSAGYNTVPYGILPTPSNDASDYLDAGTWTANGQTNPFSVNIRSLSDGSVYGDVLASGNFGQISLPNLPAHITKKGRFSIHAADVTPVIYPPGSSSGGTSGGTDSGGSDGSTGTSAPSEQVNFSISGQIDPGNITGSIHLTSIKPKSTSGTNGTTGSTPSFEAAAQTTDNSASYTPISGAGSFSVVADDQAPVVSAGADQVGQTLDRTGSFTAENSGNNWTATVDYGDGTGIQSLALNSNQTFTLLHTYTADGVYTVNVNVTDVAGNVGSSSFAFTSDTTPPTVTIDQTQAVYTNSAAATTITGTYSDANPNPDGVIVTIAAGGQTLNVPATVDTANSTWSASVSTTTLPDGAYSITALATDLAANSSTAATTAQLVVDTNAPSITIDQSQNIYTNSGTVITGTYSDTNIDPNGIVVAINDGSGDTQNFPATVGTTNNTWSATISTTGLPDGTYNITATAADLAANSSTANTSAELVIGIPPINIDMSQLPTTTSTNFTLTGDYPNPSYVGTITVTLTNSQGNSLAPFTTYTVNTAAGTWSAPISIAGVPDAGVPDGTYTVNVTDTNTNTDVTTSVPDSGGSITVSTIGSNVHFDSTQLPLVTNTNQPLTGTYDATDSDGSQITGITVDLTITNSSGTQTSTPFPATLNSANHTWSAPINVSGLAGAYTVSATATDSNGNTGTTGAPGNFTVDNLVNTLGSDVIFATNTNSEQQITLGSAPDFTLTFQGQTTANLDTTQYSTWGDLATAIASALQALSNIGTGNVSVLAQSGTEFLVTFTGSMAGKAEPTMASSDSTAVVLAVQPGGAQWPVVTSTNYMLNGTYTNPDSQNGPDGNSDNITAIIINLIDSQGNVKSFAATLIDGNWFATVDVSGLTDGTYTVTATVFDSNGNTGTAVAPGTFTVN